MCTHGKRATVAYVAPPGGHLTVSPHTMGQMLKMPELTQKGWRFRCKRIVPFYHVCHVDLSCFIVFMFMFTLFYHVYHVSLLCPSC